MKLYHGSNVEIVTPDLALSKPFKDFGKGFYLSPIYEQAFERGKQRVDFMQEGIPCVTVFEWDEHGALADKGLTVQYFFGTEHALDYLRRL